jgi:serine/threonine-protein kinase HipA
MFSFFDGLIPEGWLLAISEENWKVDRRDRMGLLLSVCADPIGSVSVRRVKE